MKLTQLQIQTLILLYHILILTPTMKILVMAIQDPHLFFFIMKVIQILPHLIQDHYSEKMTLLLPIVIAIQNNPVKIQTIISTIIPLTRTKAMLIRMTNAMENDQFWCNIRLLAEKVINFQLIFS